MPATRVRLQRLRRAALRRADALLVTHLPNIRYLSGFTGSNAALVVTRRRAALFVPRMYRLQAVKEARNVAVRPVPGAPVPAAGHWLARQRLGRIADEEDHLTAAQRAQLEGLLRRKQQVVATASLVERIRARKDEGEIELLRAALQVTASAFEEVLPFVRPGVRERELAAELEYRMKRHGASGAAFETIVASGARSALPHGRASEKRLAKNELVVFDLGAILAGYHG
ncbi:MAG: M24 family metallopeptidase, partial [Terriglobia bacterium]